MSAGCYRYRSTRRANNAATEMSTARFGHIGLAVPDVEAAAKRWEAMGIEFVKKPADGKMKGIAFIKDPDG